MILLTGENPEVGQDVQADEDLWVSEDFEQNYRQRSKTFTMAPKTNQKMAEVTLVFTFIKSKTIGSWGHVNLCNC